MKTLCLLVCLALSAQAQFDFTDLPYLAQANRGTAGGTWTPDLAPGIVFWYAARDYSALPDGTLLTNILDKTVNQNHATNPAVQFSPVLTNSLVNGKAALCFIANSNRFLQVSNSAPFGTLQSGEVFAVLKSTRASLGADNINGAALWQMENTKVAGTEFNSLHPNYSNVIVEAFGAQAAAVAPTTWGQDPTSWHIYNVFTETNHMEMRYNGELIGGLDLTGPTGFTNTVLIGASARSGALSYYQGQIAEIITYSNVLSAANRSNVTVYLSTLYGIACTNTAQTYDPTNFAAFAGRWDADILAGVIADGAAVVVWSNSVSGGQNWTNGTAGERPTWTSNLFNGHSAVSWDPSAARRLYLNPDQPYLTNQSGGAFTILSVAKLTNDYNTLLCHATDNKNYIRLRNGGVNQDSLGTMGVGDHFNNTYARNGSNLCMSAVGQIASYGQIIWWQNMTNGINYGSTNLDPVTWYCMGKHFQVPGGNVCEVLYFQTNLNNADITKLYYTYFRPKWGLP
ncbi:MAG: hypothetical protein ABFD89_03855 [Bryobacteraceae bacterium]